VDLPTGTVTFFFTDIEVPPGCCTRSGPNLWAAAGRAQRHHARGDRPGEGVEIRTEGDAFFAVFGSPAGAVLAATEAQKGHSRRMPGPTGRRSASGSACNTGEGSWAVTTTWDRRQSGCPHRGGGPWRPGGRRRRPPPVSSTRALPDGVVLRDLGLPPPQGLPRPLAASNDLVIAGLPSDFAQLRSLDARPTNLPTERPRSWVARS
jgi:hypothetical protein